MFKEKNMLPLFTYIADFTTAKQLKIEGFLRVCHKKIYNKTSQPFITFLLSETYSQEISYFGCAINDNNASSFFITKPHYDPIQNEITIPSSKI